MDQQNVRALFPALKSPLHNRYSNSQNTVSAPLINRRPYNRTRTNKISTYSEITCYLCRVELKWAEVDHKAFRAEKNSTGSRMSADVQVWKLGWGLLGELCNRLSCQWTHTHTHSYGLVPTCSIGKCDLRVQRPLLTQVSVSDCWFMMCEVMAIIEFILQAVRMWNITMHLPFIYFLHHVKHFSVCSPYSI